MLTYTKILRFLLLIDEQCHKFMLFWNQMVQFMINRDYINPTVGRRSVRWIGKQSADISPDFGWFLLGRPIAK